MFKKKRIKEYLNKKKEQNIFDNLLNLYISNELYIKLKSWGLNNVSIYVEWKFDCKMMDIQAKYNDYFYEWQFDENECSYMIYNESEPDEPIYLSYSMFNNINELLLKMKSLITT